MSKLGHPRTLAILRAQALGDLLCVIPACRALRATLPDTAIYLIGLPWSASFARRFSHIFTGFIEFPGYPGLIEQSYDPVATVKFLRSVQDRHLDVAIQMHGAGPITNPLIQLLGARLTAGFYAPGNYLPNSDLFLEYPEHEHEIRRSLRLMEFLGIPLAGEHLEFPLTPTDSATADRLLARHHLLGAKYAVIHAGATSSRPWPPEHFAAVATALAAHGLAVVLTGTTPERLLAGHITQLTGAPLVNLVGRTDLGALAALVSRAAVVVCNDTGISHLAAATATPSVVIFSTSDPTRWAPLDHHLHRALLPHQPQTPEAVMAEVLNLLGS